MLPSCPDVIPFTESTQFDRDLSRNKDNIILFVTHFLCSTLFYFHRVSSAGPASFGFWMMVEFWLAVFSCCRFVFLCCFWRDFSSLYFSQTPYPMHRTFFFPPLFSFHRLRLSIRLVAACEQTAPGIPRGTSGRVPATPRKVDAVNF